MADGAADHGPYLQQHTTSQCVDFQHAVSSGQRAAKAACPRSLAEREEWVERWCSRLKHEVGAAARLLTELRGLQVAGMGGGHREDLEAAVSYFRNHRHPMPSAERVAAHLPIGSGVTEAACQTIVKMRMCRSGAKWKTRGAGVVLSWRTLSYSAGRWEQFWAKVDQDGFPIEMAA